LNLRAIDYYMPLNPDVRLAPHYIEKLMQGLQANQAGWGTGKLLLDMPDLDPYLYSTGHALRRDGYATNIGHKLQVDSDSSVSREIFGAPGAAALISKGLITDVAPDGELFDRSMFMYSEDVDLDWRARRLGWRCWYVAEAEAIHRGGKASRHLRTMALGNRFLSVLKNAYWRDLIFYNLPLMTVHCSTRLLASPRQGLWLCVYVARGVWPMMRKRRKPRIKHQAMQRWFDEAKTSATGQPRNLYQRLRDYWQRRRD
jgi:GT2 family glycosyltransferase